MVYGTRNRALEEDPVDRGPLRFILAATALSLSIIVEAGVEI